MRPEFVEGVDSFVDYAMTLEHFKLDGLISVFEKKRGRPLAQDELFKATHTRKKKNSEDSNIWTRPIDSRGMPLSQKQVERILLNSVGGSSRYEIACGMPQQTFHEFYSGLEGLGSFHDDESMRQETILAMEKKIAELSSQAEASQTRERWRDIEYAGMKAQLDALLASGGILPCPSDAFLPPRPP
ncbi:hypothetical protein HAX54_034388 [Datura stramonium]|uniref:Uncharacterized protein n=1 Tax=Datura stramonium TaxID=4076 RepID=A0ABS8SE60_DATST|nr:hypothetical protein [Datura stramonium]